MNAETIESIRERVRGNCWDTYLASKPPRDWPAIVDVVLLDARALEKEIERMKRELNAAVAHHADYTKAIDLALGEPRYSGSLQQNHCAEIERLKKQIEQMEGAIPQ